MYLDDVHDWWRLHSLQPLHESLLQELAGLGNNGFTCHWLRCRHEVHGRCPYSRNSAWQLTYIHARGDLVLGHASDIACTWLQRHTAADSVFMRAYCEGATSHPHALAVVLCAAQHESNESRPSCNTQHTHTHMYRVLPHRSLLCVIKDVHAAEFKQTALPQDGPILRGCLCARWIIRSYCSRFEKVLLRPVQCALALRRRVHSNSDLARSHAADLNSDHLLRSCHLQFEGGQCTAVTSSQARNLYPDLHQTRCWG